MPAVSRTNLGPGPAVGQVDEALAGEEVVPYVVDDPLHPWLVGRGPHPGGVDDEAPRLGVLDKHVVEPGAVFSASMTIDFMLSGMTTGKTPPKNPHAASKPLDHLFGGLGEGRPDELVAAEARREDEPVADPALLAVGNEPETAKVDLELDARRRVVDPHGRPPPSRPRSARRRSGPGSGAGRPYPGGRAGSRS